MALYNPRKLSSPIGTASPSADPMRKQGFLMRRQKTKQNLASLDASSQAFHAQLRGEMLSGSLIKDTVNSNVNQWQELQNNIAGIRDKPTATKINLEKELAEYDLTLTEELYGKKGSDPNELVPQSYYNDPLNVEGFTRNAGGAPKVDQEKAMKMIIHVGNTLQATQEEVAMALAIARHESGFNIYAAARSSSAYGLGQFIDSTGKEYGLRQDNRDSLEDQASALIEFTQYNFKLAEDRGKSLEYVYKYHHDGPTNNSGGLAIGKENVMPYYTKYLAMIRGQQAT